MDILPDYGFKVAFGTSDAAGCNWVAFKSLSSYTIGKVLPKSIIESYPEINFDIKLVYQDPVTDEYTIFLPDMPHLSKNICTALEYSASGYQKRNIKYGKCPVNLGLVEDVWQRCDGASCQLQETKLSNEHFDKNAYSRMNVSLTMQVLSASVAKMIRDAINDDEVVLSLKNKGIYNHIANLCEKWNDVFDNCNGRDGPHAKGNTAERQKVLLDTLSWFSKWKSMHDDAMKKDGEKTTYFIFLQMKHGSVFKL